jgi:hypothetical protein
MKKYSTDGHITTPTPEVIRIGTVLRVVGEDSSISPFSDNVVIGITWNNTSMETLVEAFQAIAKIDGDIQEHSKIEIHLARPYLYANTIGSMRNYLQSVEIHSTNLRCILKYYKIVEMSTGEPANYAIER